MKRILLIVGFIILIASAAVGWYVWSSYSKFMKVEVVTKDPLLTIYLGGGNSVVLHSEDGKTALIVDTKMRSAAQALKSHIKAENIIIVNTHDHLDHVGGNALYPAAKMIAGAYAKEQWDKDSSQASRYPDTVLKPGEEQILKIGGETVHLVNMGRAHTYNDVVVYFENRKLLVTGDLVFNQMHPALIARSGTKVALWIDTLEKLSKKYKIQTLIPGHGPVADQNALLAMRDYFTSIRNAIGREDQLAALKEKYKDYVSMPFVFSFGHTREFIQKEQSAGN